jgi:hypothetical protein
MGFLGFDRVFGEVVCPIPRRVSEPYAAHESLMAATHREIAILGADMMGAQAYLGQFGPGDGAEGPARSDRRLLRPLLDEAAEPVLIVDPRPGLHIVDFNAAHAAVSMIDRRHALGEKLFDVFPDNPDLPNADGVSNLYESLQQCARSGRTHRMRLQRFDMRDRTGLFVKRHWRPVNSPLCDDKGRLVFLVHRIGEAVEV